MWSPTAPARLVTSLRGSRATLDLVVAAAALTGSLALLAHGGVVPTRPGVGRLDLLGVVLAACSTAPLVGWRRFPLGVFAATGTAGVLLAAFGYPADLLPGPAAALYLLAATREPTAPGIRRITATAIGILGAHLVAAAATQGAFPAAELFHTGLAWAVAWFAGERSRLRRDNIADLRQRALRAERESDRERQFAAAEERARIARDLHDSAGHAISVIAVRAGAARLRHPQDPDRSLAALEAIEDLARKTVADMDQIVGTLRSGPAAKTVEAPAGLASFDTLVTHHSSAGLAVSVSRSGTPRPLSTAADQAAYRILQEALTNAARHGAGSARIELAFHDNALVLTITNPVLSNPVSRDPLTTGAAEQPVGGHGLIGMRERTTLLDGSLATERANGAFRVCARIPYVVQRP